MLDKTKLGIILMFLLIILSSIISNNYGNIWEYLLQVIIISPLILVVFAFSLLIMS